ncbi:hypothetical protein AT05_02110 [Schleiferia thermophila str. Yellowstone]|nr:hypothetical protein AT05_02110 [Schleiferia thermophila str. Yellowstone]
MKNCIRLYAKMQRLHGMEFVFIVPFSVVNSQSNLSTIMPMLWYVLNELVYNLKRYYFYPNFKIIT